MKPFDLPNEPRVTELSYPTRVVLGAGALARLPAQVARLGMKKPLIVTDAGVVKAGLLERVTAVLSAAKIAFHVFADVQQNPTDKDASEGLAAYRAGGCDGVIGVGGGSPLDAAKLVQLLTTHPLPLSRYDDAKGGDQFVNDDLPPSIAIPTTAGTGSEVGRSGVVTLADTGRKTVIFSPHLLPDAAIIDPELTVGLPPAITAATGMDAFTHCLEAYISNGFNPLSDAVAIDGLRRVTRSLPVAFANGADVDARLDVMIGAMEGAMAFQKGLGAAHALAHALTPLTGLHHGLSNAIVLPTVLEFNRAVVTSRLAHVAVAMGESSVTREEVLAGNAIERVRKLNQTLKIPSRLRDVGVKEESLGKIADHAFEDSSHLGNPRKCTRDDLLSLLKTAF